MTLFPDRGCRDDGSIVRSLIEAHVGPYLGNGTLGTPNVCNYLQADYGLSRFNTGRFAI